MVNQKLVALIAAGTLLSLGHTADHVLRDNLRWPSTELFTFVIVGVVIYGVIGAGLYLYVKSKVGHDSGPSSRFREFCSVGPRISVRLRTSRRHSFCEPTTMAPLAG
jgi:hypothetical protein